LVTVPPTVSVVPEIEEAVPEAFEIEGSFEIGEPEKEELAPRPPMDDVPATPPAPTIIV
jgi:hypothetical protein